MKNSLIPSRLAKRANLEAETIYPILDEAIYCTVSYVMEGKPYAIPTSFVRYEDKVYVHGSVGSHFIRQIKQGGQVCISVSLMDSLVLAKSAFHHSINYRSVVIFGQAEEIIDPDEKRKAFQWLTDKMVPGSWDYLRPMLDMEVQKTSVLAFPLNEASAKTRQGMPSDDPADEHLPIWSGLIPLSSSRLRPVSSPESERIELPSHLRSPIGWA